LVVVAQGTRAHLQLPLDDVELSWRVLKTVQEVTELRLLELAIQVLLFVCPETK
jgi:hypothetical protein